jgi:hypothetical protein
MATSNNNGYVVHPPTRSQSAKIDELIDSISTQVQSLANLATDLYEKGKRRQIVIRNLDDAVVLEIPLNGVIIGSVLLTMMMRLRWVVLVSLVTLFGRFYVTIEQIDETLEAEPDEITETETAVERPKRTRRATASTNAKRLEA